MLLLVCARLVLPGRRQSGMPMAMESCTEGMLTSAIHSVTGCSTCRHRRHTPTRAAQ